MVSSCDELKTLIGYLTCYFPFKPAYRDIKVGIHITTPTTVNLRCPQVEQAFRNLNVIYCELTSLVVLVSSWWSSEGGRREDTCMAQRRSAKNVGKPDIHTELVRSYIVRALNGEGETGALLSRPLTPLAYIALLPSVWALLNHSNASSDEDVSLTVLAATLDHGMRTASNSAVKRLTVEFVARLLLVSVFCRINFFAYDLPAWKRARLYRAF